MFNIFNVSVPIPTTTISTITASPSAGLFNIERSVDNPDILTTSLFFRLWFMLVKILIWFSDQVMIELSFFSIVVSTDCIAFPEIFDINDTNPSPSVFWLSNCKNSLTL